MATTGPPPPLGIAKDLPQGGLIALAWVGVALAGCFVVARTTIRFHTLSRLEMDDYWIYAAWSILCINAIVTTLQAPHLYYLVQAVAGLVPQDEKLLYHGNKYVRYEFPSIGLFWTVLWCVKGSFLTLFWKLFEGLRRYKRWWWGVVVFTALTYCGCWIASGLNCHPPNTYFQFGQCNKEIDMRGGVISVAYSTTADVVTDIMIMALPLQLLYNLRITLRQKIGLTAVFLLALITIIVAIVRATQITGKLRSDAVLLAVWSLIESSISVIVGCLPPFKSLFSRNAFGNPRSSRSSNYHSSYHRNRLSGIPLNSGDYSGNQTRIKAKGFNDRWPSSDSKEGIISHRSDNMQLTPMQGDIRVQKDILVRTEVPNPVRMV